MHISKERRDRWQAVTKHDAFNTWIRPQILGPDGNLDVERLHALAMTYGIDKRSQYAHLNPGQQRMSLGNILRKVVPVHLYERASLRPTTSSRPTDGASVPEASPLARASLPELLRLHAEVMDELRRREVTRTLNNPAGDYAEFLFAMTFGWALEGNSAAGHDATDSEGLRYQIKSRHLTPHNKSRQLSFMRGLPDKKFDYLAAVLFDQAYRVHRAIILPHAPLEAMCRYSAHANAWVLRPEDSCWSVPGARDVTDELRKAEKSI